MKQEINPKKWNIANILTGCRILCGILLLELPVRSAAFLIVYLVAGFTDMIDGTVARRLHCVSEFGSKLDTAADMVFVAAALWKLLPVLEMPRWAWIWTGVIAFTKLINVLSGILMRKEFVSVHTLANKVTGLLLFAWPLVMLTNVASVVNGNIVIGVLCAVATFAAVQEGHLIRTGKN